jgi:cytochrome b
MNAGNQLKVWDLPLRMFHWLLAAAIALAFLSAEEDSPLNQWHISAGWAVGILIVFRLVWGFVGGEHSRFSDFVRPRHVAGHLAGLAKGRIEPSVGHNPLGAVAVLLMLGLAAAAVWTGAFGGGAAEDLHELIGWTLLALVVVHILAVLIMSVLQRENLLRAMISGTKPADRHPDTADAKPPGAVAVIVAALVAAAALFAVLRYDAQAFTPRPADTLEQARRAAPQPVPGHDED